MSKYLLVRGVLYLSLVITDQLSARASSLSCDKQILVPILGDDLFRINRSQAYEFINRIYLFIAVKWIGRLPKI